MYRSNKELMQINKKRSYNTDVLKDSMIDHASNANTINRLKNKRQTNIMLDTNLKTTSLNFNNF